MRQFEITTSIWSKKGLQTLLPRGALSATERIATNRYPVSRPASGIIFEKYHMECLILVTVPISVTNALYLPGSDRMERCV